MHQRNVNLRKGRSKKFRISFALSFVPGVEDVAAVVVGRAGDPFCSISRVSADGYACALNHRLSAASARKNQYRNFQNKTKGNP